MMLLLPTHSPTYIDVVAPRRQSFSRLAFSGNKPLSSQVDGCKPQPQPQI